MSQTSGFVRQGKWVGWKMSTATLELLLISHACVWRYSPPHRVTSEEQGWHWWDSLLYYFVSAYINATSFFYSLFMKLLAEIQTIVQNSVDLSSFKPCMKNLWFPPPLKGEERIYFYSMCARLFDFHEQIRSACVHTVTHTMYQCIRSTFNF